MHLSLLVLARADWPVGFQWAARPLAPGRAPSRLGPDSESPPGPGCRGVCVWWWWCACQCVPQCAWLRRGFSLDVRFGLIAALDWTHVGSDPI